LNLLDFKGFFVLNATNLYPNQIFFIKERLVV
jgi:hypothetical protein